MVLTVIRQEKEAEEPYCGAVKVHNKRLHSLRDLSSHVECVWDHAEVDICRVVFVIYGPGVEIHSASCYGTHSKVIFSCDTCGRENG